ncbi:unnamed protein product [Dimorphilus gyrociliatus]|uniref:Proteasome assembly chaperone 2 n=1 Tax=Dimorphilus gyrociliatus TaxID=2664684 RepID=A0A7I8W8B7_9ANNE|nr:unnamed protein product [Dimorphilus gyrociliatus]
MSGILLPASSRLKSDWTDYTLIIASNCVGNVGQLSADLLISTLWLNKIAYLHTDLLLPAVGNDPYATGKIEKTCKLSTCCELYENEALKLAIIQLRSRIAKGRKGEYVRRLEHWIRCSKFENVIIVSSSNLHKRQESEIKGPTFKYLISDTLKESAGKVLKDSLEWKEHEYESIDNVQLPGSGIALPLFSKCSKFDMNIILIFVYTERGDNLQNAYILCNMLNDWKGWLDMKKSGKTEIAKGQWKPPVSWRWRHGYKKDDMYKS